MYVFAKSEKRGFTLIELMIVILIVLVIFTGAALSLGAASKANLRSSCWSIASAVRYAYSHAATKGMTVRLVMNFESKTFHLEETTGRVVLNPEDTSGSGLKRTGGDEDFFGPDAGILNEMDDIDPLRERFPPVDRTGQESSQGMGFMPFGMGSAGQSGQDNNAFMQNMMYDLMSQGTTDPFLRSLSGMSASKNLGYQKPSFEKIKRRAGEEHKLKGSTSFHAVYTPHEPGARTDGNAFIYFFPRGMAEHCIVQLADKDEKIYSIEVHPLTGKAFIYLSEVEPEEDLKDFSEAEE